MKQDTALLVIDMQNDFIEPDGFLEVPGIKENAPKFKDFIAKLRKKGILIIYTRHCYDPKKNPIERKLFPEMDENGLRINTSGWQIIESLKPEKDDTIIDKPRYDAFYKTDLEEVLKSHNIKRVIISGTMTDVCCDSTARSAMIRDLEVIFCSDLNFCSDEMIQAATLKTISLNFGQVMSSQEILSHFNS